MPPAISKISSNFKSSVHWTPEEWQRPLDSLFQWLHQHAYGGRGFTGEQWRELNAINEHFAPARAANDMHGFRRTVNEYRDKAAEFFKLNSETQPQSQPNP